MNALRMIVVRVGLRRVAAECDRAFDLARGVPRTQGIRWALEAMRKDRAFRAEFKRVCREHQDEQDKLTPRVLDVSSRRATQGSGT